MCVLKRKLKIQDYKNCSEAAQIENKINHLVIFFTEEINKIALSSNDDKRMQSIDLIETYAYGMNKDVVCNKEEIKCNNIIKQYKNVKL